MDEWGISAIREQDCRIAALRRTSEAISPLAGEGAAPTVCGARCSVGERGCSSDRARGCCANNELGGRSVNERGRSSICEQDCCTDNK